MCSTVIVSCNNRAGVGFRLFFSSHGTASHRLYQPQPRVDTSAGWTKSCRRKYHDAEDVLTWWCILLAIPPPPAESCWSCQVMLDDLTAEAPPDVLQDAMLSVVLPLARHAWRRVARDTAARGGTSLRRKQQQQPLPPQSPPLDHHNRHLPPPPPSQGKIESADQWHRGSDVSGTAAVSEAAQEDDGFEMVEAPDEGGHTPPTAHGGGAAHSSSAPSELYRESSGGRGRGGGGGGGESSACGRDDDDDEDGGDDVGSRQVSSPALLALLLMLKSFLKNLSALRRGDRFCEVWHQVRIFIAPLTPLVYFCSFSFGFSCSFGYRSWPKLQTAKKQPPGV